MSENHVTGVVAKNSLAYVEAIFGCYQKGETVVLLRNPDDQRVTLTGVTKVIDPVESHGWFTDSYQFRTDDVLAQIAFTSGTEGEPKGVLLTHQALSDVTERLNDIMEVDTSIREYVGIPANFSFGLGRFRAVSAAGGQAYLPENGFDPLEIRDMLSAGQINSVSAVPSLWRVLLKNKQIFGQETHNLKWIEIGSQYMSRKEKEELKALFPNAKIAQHYGLTEASRSSFLRIDEIDGEHLESVGKAYGRTEFKISDEGRVCIRGPHVATQLLKDGEYVSNIDEEGWFHTSDLGEIHSGFLYFLGRADDQINAAGIKLSPDNIERALREQLGLKDGIAVAALPDESLGHRILVGVLSALESRKEDIEKIGISLLQTYGIRNPGMLKIGMFEQFPVTSTNKVQRKKLAQCYLEQAPLQSHRTYIAPKTDLEVSLCRAWEDVLKQQNIGIDDSFFERGGDSLMAVMAVHEMSKMTGIDFNIGQLFNYPTIRLLIEQVNNGDVPISSVVTLQKMGKGIPIFCLFGLNLYQALANALGTEQPVYGIYVSQEETLLNELTKGELSGSLATKLANLYCEAIVRQQAHGPYQLIGISFGGVVAVEAAKILQKRGEQVHLVVLLDSILPSGVQRSVIKNFAFKLRMLKELGRANLDRFRGGQKPDVKAFEQYRKQAFHKAMQSYIDNEERFDGKVLLVKAKDQSSWGRGVRFKDDYGWSAFLKVPPTCHAVEGSHLEIIDKNNATNVADFIRPYLFK